MYKSPIDIIYGQMETQMEGDILRAVQKYGINVDKEELVRALNYDREQYYNGYADGRNDALADLVRCKDCKHWSMGYCNHFAYYSYEPMTNEDDFCSYGERKMVNLEDVLNIEAQTKANNEAMRKVIDFMVAEKETK